MSAQAEQRFAKQYLHILVGVVTFKVSGVGFGLFSLAGGILCGDRCVGAHSGVVRGKGQVLRSHPAFVSDIYTDNASCLHARNRNAAQTRNVDRDHILIHHIGKFVTCQTFHNSVFSRPSSHSYIHCHR